MKVFFIVGEDSGDAIAASLIKRLKTVHGDNINCYGIGGPLMKAAGFNVQLSSAEMTAFGILEVVPKIPFFWKIHKAVIEEIETKQPDIVVTVDFPDFNFMVAKSLKHNKRFKGKIIHYVAPSVWAWREARAKKIAALYDGIMCLFPMEVEYFTKHGLKAVCVGHPLVESFIPSVQDKGFRTSNNIPENATTLGLFFGSRDSEFKKMSAVLKDAARYVADSIKNLYIIAPILPRHEFHIQNVLDNFKIPVLISSNPEAKWRAFQACDVAIAVSGTVGLELAYANVPHIITYKLNPLSYYMVKSMTKVKYAHLANILLDKPIVPEFIQGNCQPETLASSIISLIKNKEKQTEMQEEFKALRSILGEGQEQQPSEKAAEFVLSMIKKK